MKSKVKPERMTKLWTHHVISNKEDCVLTRLVLNQTNIDWKITSISISKELKIERTAKQCRDRWINNLNKQSSSRLFSNTEMQLLLKIYDDIGPKWAEISVYFPFRSENFLKNHLNATIRRNVRRFNKGRPENEKIKSNKVELIRHSELRCFLTCDKTKKADYFSNIKLSVGAKVCE